MKTVADEGSITIESLLILPVVFLVLTLFIKIGQEMYGNLQLNNVLPEEYRLSEKLPADWIRQTDLLLDWGRGLKELWPTWLTER